MVLAWYVDEHIPFPNIPPCPGVTTQRTTNTSPRYQARLAARPLLTQSITTSILFGVGDITAQQVVEKKGLDKHDFARTGRMVLYGGSMYPCPLPTYIASHGRPVRVPCSIPPPCLARIHPALTPPSTPSHDPLPPQTTSAY